MPAPKNVRKIPTWTIVKNALKRVENVPKNVEVCSRWRCKKIKKLSLRQNLVAGKNIFLISVL